MDVTDGFDVLIERRLLVKTEGDPSPKNISIEIGHPYWTIDGIEAACPVAIRGLIGRTRDIRGIDPMDSLKQALQFVDTYLSGVSCAPLITWPDGEAYF